MDIDDRLIITFENPGRENLHVPSEHDDVDGMLTEDSLDSCLLIELRVLRHGQVTKRDAMTLDPRREIGVIGDHQGKLGIKLFGLPPPEHVDQAMPLPSRPKLPSVWGGPRS